ncbi:hypothetical protein Agub_g2583, partial [Astrephomene gubernaculifera]
VRPPSPPSRPSPPPSAVAVAPPMRPPGGVAAAAACTATPAASSTASVAFALSANGPIVLLGVDPANPEKVRIRHSGLILRSPDTLTLAGLTLEYLPPPHHHHPVAPQQAPTQPVPILPVT